MLRRQLSDIGYDDGIVVDDDELLTWVLGPFIYTSLIFLFLMD